MFPRARKRWVTSRRGTTIEYNKKVSFKPEECEENRNGRHLLSHFRLFSTIRVLIRVVTVNCLNTLHLFIFLITFLYFHCLLRLPLLCNGFKNSLAHGVDQVCYLSTYVVDTAMVKLYSGPECRTRYRNDLYSFSLLRSIAISDSVCLSFRQNILKTRF